MRLAQVQPQVQQPQPQPQLDTNFFASVGVTGGILVLLATAIAKTLPNYLDRFFQLKEESMKARMQAEIREQDSDLKRDESTHGTLNEFTRTLLANQLQTSKQFQEEFAGIIHIQHQQIGIVLHEIEKSAANQQRFFEISDQLKRELSDIRLEIEKNRKAINDKSE
jgi:hypothetical protein